MLGIISAAEGRRKEGGRAGMEGPLAQQGAQHQPSLSPGLTEMCRDCGQRSLDYLGELKDKQRLRSAELGDVRRALRGVLQLAQVGDGAQRTHLPACGWPGRLFTGIGIS